MNRKLQQIMADKSRPKTTEEQEGMARMLKAVRLKREQALKAQQEVRDEEGHRTAQE